MRYTPRHLRSGDIGVNPREVEYEPLSVPAPVPTAPEPEPIEVPDPELVPA